jgi:hypothetical protein
MISYQVYKVLHLIAIFLFLTGASVLLSGQRTRFWMILTGVASFFILFGGMGLMARLGGGFQPWILVKIAIWLVVTALGHLVAKRFPVHGRKAYWLTMILAGTAAWLAVYKPF